MSSNPELIDKEMYNALGKENIARVIGRKKAQHAQKPILRLLRIFAAKLAFLTELNHSRDFSGTSQTEKSHQ